MTGYEVMETLLGKQEARDRKELKDFFRKYSIKDDILVDPSTTPWCAAIVNACERAAGKKGTGKLNARSFEAYGTKIQLADIKKGDILIFKRGTSPWQGHVTYFSKWDGNDMICLGGNQSDQVCFSRNTQHNLLGIRRC